MQARAAARCVEKRWQGQHGGECVRRHTLNSGDILLTPRFIPRGDPRVRQKGNGAAASEFRHVEERIAPTLVVPSAGRARWRAAVGYFAGRQATTPAWTSYRVHRLSWPWGPALAQFTHDFRRPIPGSDSVISFTPPIHQADAATVRLKNRPHSAR
jgi:hypothetical protein